MGRRWRKALMILVLVLGMILQSACSQEKPSYQVGGTSLDQDKQVEYGGGENASVSGDGIVEIEVLAEMSDDVYKGKEMIMAVKWSTFKDGRIYGDGFYYPKMGGKFVSNAFSGGNVWEKSVTGRRHPLSGLSGSFALTRQAISMSMER